ncbi:MAG: hypothetical protein O2968_00880 [Acidobacteria bacterium]|nr:hypothetical protein [Acidobacteriota bacterium]
MYLRNATIAVLFSALLYSPLFLFSKPEGFEIDARVTGYPFPGEGSCAQSDCHGDGMGANKGMGNIAISIHGQPASAYSYSPGETVPVRVTISEPSSLQQRFGFQITSRTPDGCTQAGMFSMAGDPNLLFFLDSEATAPCQPEPIQFVTHGLAATREPPSMQPVTFELNWTAPSTDIGPIVIAAAGNAANGDTEETGDNIYTTGEMIEPVAGGGAEPPVISAVLNNATNLLENEPGSAVAPGTGISIFGEGFASHLPVPLPAPLVSLQIPLETTLGDLTVTIDGFAMPIFGIFREEDFGVGFDQINGQLPWGVLAGGKSTATMLITSGGVTSEPREITVEPASPGIYSWGFGPGPGIVTNFVLGKVEFAQAPGTFCASFGLAHELCVPTDPEQVPVVNEKAAEVGGIITVWANGLGPLSGMVASGDIPEPEAGLLFATKTVKVIIGGREAEVLGGAILHPIFVALNQINVRIPEGLTPGDAVPIVIEVDCGDGNVFSSRGDVTIAVAAAP